MLRVIWDIGGRAIGTLCIANNRQDDTPPEQYPYYYEYYPGEMTSDKEPFAKGEIIHDYNEGAWDLVLDVLADMLIRHPKLVSSGRPRNRVECPECGDIIESIYRHDYRVCCCGATMTDGGQSEVHQRRGGVEPPEETEIERIIKRLARNDTVTIHSAPGGRFALTCRAGENTVSKQVRQWQHLEGPSLLALLREAEKRDKRGA